MIARLFEVFMKAGAFVFGSGLAIVPFLYGGVVRQFQWLTEAKKIPERLLILAAGIAGLLLF